MHGLFSSVNVHPSEDVVELILLFDLLSITDEVVSLFSCPTPFECTYLEIINYSF